MSRTHTQWPLSDNLKCTLYKHDGNRKQATAEVKKSYSQTNTGANDTYMGNTLHALSFVDHGIYNATGALSPVGKIEFNSNWAQRSVDKILSDEPTAAEYAFKARSNKEYDIKNGYETYGSIIGYGKGHVPVYATGRDAGNFAAGAVAARSMLPTNLLLNGFGAYNLAHNKVIPASGMLGLNYIVSGLTGVNILSSMPTHGEDPLTYKAIESGMSNHTNYFYNSIHGRSRYTINGTLR